MDEDQLKEIAAQLSRPTGERGAAMGEKMNDTNAFITARAIERLAARAGESVVEIGPGNGVLSLPIVEALGSDGRYLGLELSDGMAAQARETLAGAAAAIDIRAGDCMSAPVAPDSADAIMAVNLIYFIEDLPALFARFRSWLKPAGRVVLGIRSPESLGSMPFSRYGFRIRPLEEIQQTFEQTGFAQVDSMYFDEGRGALGDLEITVDALIIRASAA